MAQLSRPFQIGLAAVVLMAGVWVFALRPHSSSPESASSPVVSTTATQTPSPSAHASAPAAKGPGAPSSVYHGSAPGVEGLTRAVARAHEAVATSEHNASQLQQKSEQASSPTSTPEQSASKSSSSSSSSASSAAAASTSAPAASATKPSSTSSSATKSDPTAAGRRALPAREHEIESALAKGKIALLLFWDPKGSDDVAVHRAVRSLQGDAHLKIFLAEATAKQVTEFGTITRGVEVYGTPTLMLINKKDEVFTLTGLQDAYTVRQAIEEARHPLS